MTQSEFSRDLSTPLRSAQVATRLFRRWRLVKTRLATIGRVAMNDPALGRLVDCGNRRANLIGAALWRGADLFLQSAQVRLNASIMDRSPKSLSGTFAG
jgi:hypothetical protein